MPDIAILNPASLGKPLGQYSQIARVRASEFVFIAGQVATNSAGDIVGAGDFEAQCVQVFANIEAALGSVGRKRCAVHDLPCRRAGYRQAHGVSRARIPGEIR
jgi:enamine deaminase RidA (YjgF/YER057c/UK114 family)